MRFHRPVRRSRFARGPRRSRRPCNDCGQVMSIRFVEEKGKSSGLGAVAGGVLGGVLGHQIGSGTGRTVATVAGAAGGAYVGNTVEKNKNAKTYVARHDPDGRRQTPGASAIPTSRSCTKASASSSSTAASPGTRRQLGAGVSLSIGARSAPSLVTAVPAPAVGARSPIAGPPLSSCRMRRAPSGRCGRRRSGCRRCATRCQDLAEAP